MFLTNIITFVSKMIELREWVNAKVIGYNISDEYVKKYYTFLDDLVQDTDTGYFGAKYKSHGASSTAVVYSTDDLSMTFHITKYRKGDVLCVSDIGATTLAIKNQPYPYGWGLYALPDGQTAYDNHNSFDVATLLSFSWHTLNTTSMEAGREGLSSFLTWALGPHSLETNRTALVCGDSQDSYGDCYYFTVGLLDEVGYWNVSKRFWTKENFHGYRLCLSLKHALARLNITSGIVSGRCFVCEGGWGSVYV